MDWDEIRQAIIKAEELSREAARLAAHLQRCNSAESTTALAGALSARHSADIVAGLSTGLDRMVRGIACRAGQDLATAD